MLSGPSSRAASQGFWIGRHRLISKVALHLLGQLSGRGIAVLRRLGQSFQANRLQRGSHLGIDLARRLGRILANLLEQLGRGSGMKRRLAGQDLVQDCSQTVHVGAAVGLALPSLGLLGRHVGGCSQKLALHGSLGSGTRSRVKMRPLAIARCSLGGDRLFTVRLPERQRFAACKRVGDDLSPAPAPGRLCLFGQAPVQHNDLAEVSHHDVLALQVAVDYTFRMCISQRVANSHERPQELDHSHRISGSGRAVLVVGARCLAECTPLDKSHGVIRRFRFAQLVDWHDSWMLELSGDPGFGQKAGTNLRIIGLVGTELFERDLPPQGRVMSQPDLPHSSLGVKVRECVPVTTIIFPGTKRFNQHMSRWRAR